MNTAAQVVRGAPIAALSHPLLPLSRCHAPTSLFQKDCFSVVLFKTAGPPDVPLECAGDRNAHASALITSQLPFEHWHENIGDPTIADAIMDRLIHNEASHQNLDDMVPPNLVIRYFQFLGV